MYTYKLPITKDDIISLNSSVTPLSASLNSSSSKNDLLSQLSKLDEKFKNDPLLFDISLPESLGLTQMEYDALTDEDIQKLAKSQTDSKLNDEKVKLENELNSLTAELNSQKDNLKTQADQIVSKIESNYADRRTEAENDALKRGLARSSIITGKIEQFDANKISDMLNLETEYVTAVGNIDSKIESLESQKNLALENFNITLAAELLTMINSLKDERTKKFNEVLKYNNDILEKESKYQKEKELSLFDIEQRRKNEISNEKLNDYLYSEKAKIVKTFYESIDPAEALRQIGEDSTLKEHLGTYYNYIVQYFKSKIK